MYNFSVVRFFCVAQQLGRNDRPEWMARTARAKRTRGKRNKERATPTIKRGEEGMDLETQRRAVVMTVFAALTAQHLCSAAPSPLSAQFVDSA